LQEELSSRPEWTRISDAACAAFRKVVHRRCRPAGYETGHFLSSAESATNPRVPHPLRSLQRVGYATVGIEIRGIPPFAKSAKDGAPAHSWCFLLYQTPTAAANATKLDRKSGPSPVGTTILLARNQWTRETGPIRQSCLVATHKFRRRAPTCRFPLPACHRECAGFAESAAQSRYRDGPIASRY
jgi:hypothetical protein